MRTDSRGLPVRRTFIGTKEQFFDAEALMAKRDRERNKHKRKKKSSTFHNLLPNIVSPRQGTTNTGTQSSQKGAYDPPDMQKTTS